LGLLRVELVRSIFLRKIKEAAKLIAIIKEKLQKYPFSRNTCAISSSVHEGNEKHMQKCGWEYIMGINHLVELDVDIKT
jgi:hypothetical protein